MRLLDLLCKLRKGGLGCALFLCHICEGRICFDEDFVREAGAEAEAGYEVIKAIGVEKISADREQ